MSPVSNTRAVTELVKSIKSGDLSSAQLVRDCLHRIESRDNAVQAWACLDREYAQAQAGERDEQAQGKWQLPGIPVGIKDIIDTLDLPTACGTAILDGHRPVRNAECIERLVAAGAVIMGKTVTTEFAYLQPGKTRNPHNIEHTPGGSSSGSAAAVADHQVPMALGTQTAGSIIRPASYCGVVGYKPTFASFSCRGIHPFAPSLDTLGGFTRSVADMVLLRNALAGETVKIEALKPASIALLRGPCWPAAGDATRSMFEALQRMSAGWNLPVHRIELGEEFAGINDAQTKIQLKECTRSLGKYYRHDRERLSAHLCADFEYGLSISDAHMAAAYSLVALCKKSIAGVFNTCSLILTAASTGTAPEGLGSTGDPVFNRMWTALGLPCVCLPFPRQEAELPLGVQLVGAPRGDLALLAHAAWLERQFLSQNPAR